MACRGWAARYSSTAVVDLLAERLHALFPAKASAFGTQGIQPTGLIVAAAQQERQQPTAVKQRLTLPCTCGRGWRSGHPSLYIFTIFESFFMDDTPRGPRAPERHVTHPNTPEKGPPVVLASSRAPRQTLVPSLAALAVAAVHAQHAYKEEGGGRGTGRKGFGVFAFLLLFVFSRRPSGATRRGDGWCFFLAGWRFLALPPPTKRQPRGGFVFEVR